MLKDLYLYKKQQQQNLYQSNLLRATGEDINLTWSIRKSKNIGTK